ncbi:autotransporter outer membrane beta-barrel domain-containing protein [Brucella intermedia]|uniref:autotransporter outer membrane beta-barrel domain-containing protein n=1 Tax=Brucella intermedia TaxID=94625 RepID=UPI0009461FD5
MWSQFHLRANAPISYSREAGSCISRRFVASLLCGAALASAPFPAGLLIQPARAQSVTATGDVLPSGLTGSEWTISNEPLYVGRTGTGTLTIAGGGKVSVKYTGGLTSLGASIGDEAGSSGSVLVTGAGSLLDTWASQGMVIGRNGTGSLTIEDGGQVNTTVLDIGGPLIADQGSGTVLVTGNGSVLNAYELGGYLPGIRVGYTSNGSLTVQDGGKVATTFVGLGGEAGSGRSNSTGRSSVLVEGEGSLLDASKPTPSFSSGISLAYNSESTLAIRNGGKVLASELRLGAFGNGNYSTLVTGEGSELNVQATAIGSRSNLNIQNGGKVSSDLVLFNYAPSEKGTINIGGAVGEAATGSGTLEASVINFTMSEGTLNFNHTDRNDFAPALKSLFTGTHILNHMAGFTTLTGDSSQFTGTTNVSGGTLVVGNMLGGNASVTGGKLQVDALFSGPVAVSGTGAVYGAGVIDGDVTIGSGASLAGEQGQTLSVTGNLQLAADSTVDVLLGAPSTQSLFDVGGDLTLDGNLNITDAGGLGPGLYRLFNYAGNLTDNTLAIGNTPGGDPSRFWIDSDTTSRQINLMSAYNANLNIWNGGSGTWNLVADHTNDVWTDDGSNIKGPFDQGSFAVFRGTHGIVTVDNSEGDVIAAGMQFASDGYVIKGDAINLDKADGATVQPIIRVGDGTAAGRLMSATIEADLTGSQGFNKTDRGTLVLAGLNSNSGNIIVTRGTLQQGAAGSFNTASSGYFVKTDGTLNLGGFNTSLASLSNAGTITSGVEIAGTTLTVTGDYVGEGGTVVLNTELGGDNSKTDRLKVNGNTSGSTNLKVVNRGGPGAQTDKGIKVVEVAGQSDGTFTLLSNYETKDGKKAVVGGAYAYTLQQNPATGESDGDWYLTSQLTNGGGKRYSAGVPVYQGYVQNMQALNRLPTLRERMGDRYWTGQSGDGRNNGAMVDGRGVWARIEGAHNHLEPNSATGVKHDINTFILQAGIESQPYETANGILVGGITGQYGTARGKSGSTFGSGTTTTNAWSLGATTTWYGNNGFYVDGQGQISWFDNDLYSDTANNGLKSGAKALGYALSIEAGKRIAIDENWFLTPQAQLMWASLNADAFHDIWGSRVDLQDGYSLTGRIGLAASYMNSWKDNDGLTTTASVYGIANLYQQLSGKSRINVAEVSLDTDADKTWTGIGAGGSYSWGDGKYALFGEASVDTSLDDFADSYALKANVGFNTKW